MQKRGTAYRWADKRRFWTITIGLYRPDSIYDAKWLRSLVQKVFVAWGWFCYDGSAYGSL